MAEKSQMIEIIDSTEVYFVSPERAVKRQRILEKRLAEISISCLQDVIDDTELN